MNLAIKSLMASYGPDTVFEGRDITVNKIKKKLRVGWSEKYSFRKRDLKIYRRQGIESHL